MSSQNPPLVRHSLFSIHAGGRIHISLTMFSLLLEGVARVLVPACGCWRGRGESFVSNCGQSCSHEGATGAFGSCGTYLTQRTLPASHGVDLSGTKTLAPPCTANTCSKLEDFVATQRNITGAFGSCGTYLTQMTLRASHGVNPAGTKTLAPPCAANTCSKRQGYWLQVRLLPGSSLGLRGELYFSALVAMGFFTANDPRAMSRLKRTASPLRFRRLYLDQSLAGSMRPL